MSGFVSRNLFHIKMYQQRKVIIRKKITATMKRNRNDNKSVLDLLVGGKMLLGIGAKEAMLRESC